MSIKALAQAVLLRNRQRNKQETKSFLKQNSGKQNADVGKPGIESFPVSSRIGGNKETANLMQVSAPGWQIDFCIACGDFNSWRGCCPLSIDDCLLSKIIGSRGNSEALKGLVLGQGIKTDDVADLLIESGEEVDRVFKKPIWLFCLAEHLVKSRADIRDAA